MSGGINRDLPLFARARDRRSPLNSGNMQQSRYRLPSRIREGLGAYAPSHARISSPFIFRGIE